MSNILDLILLPNPPEDLPEYSRIYRKSCHTITYNEFFWNYMIKNWPVILTDVSNSWPCSKQWLQHEIQHLANKKQNNGNDELEGKQINFDFLKEKIGNVKVPVVDCNEDYFNSHKKIEMDFFQFLDYWQTKQNHDKLLENNGNPSPKETIQNNEEQMKQMKSQQIYYLKDWHLQATMPDYHFYKTPEHFCVDWLNEYLIETGRDDYRFVYMGPKNSWTPFHADVFGSFSWSTNIFGFKKWTILPPGEEQKLADSLGNLPNRIYDELLNEKHCKFFTIIQKENEAIFVPSGWYHQVWNITDTISINHNWFNGCNIMKIYENLVNNMKKVIKELDDCRDIDNYHQQCQIILRADFGMSYIDLIDLLEYIVNKRCSYSHQNHYENSNNMVYMSSRNIFFHLYKANERQINYDLNILNKIANRMLQDPVIYNIHLNQRVQKIIDLIKNNNNNLQETCEKSSKDKNQNQD